MSGPAPTARHRAGRLALVTICLAALVATFGGTVIAGASTRPSTITVARRYLVALFGVRRTPEMLQRATRFVAPDSDAEHYVQFQVALATAARDASRSDLGPVPKATFARHGSSITSCRRHGRDCATYSNIEVDGRGRLVSFSVDGQALASRLVVGRRQPASALGASFELAIAYQTTERNLFVIGRLSAGQADVAIGTLTTNYVDPTGRQVACDSAETVVPPGDLAPGAHEIVAFFFPASTLGGRVRIPVSNTAGAASIEFADRVVPNRPPTARAAIAGRGTPRAGRQPAPRPRSSQARGVASRRAPRLRAGR